MTSDSYIFPASYAQTRLWFLARLAPESSFYNVSSAIRLRFAVRPDVLARCVEELARRHETLRTTFALRDGLPVQVVSPEPSLRVETADVSGTDLETARAAARALATAGAERAFDLERGPLAGFQLIRVAAGESVLAATLHHIICDGWSLRVLFGELSALYRAFARGDPSPLPALDIQFADWVLWEREQLTGGALEAVLDHWEERLRDLPVLAMPTDHPHPPLQRYRGAQVRADIPARVAGGVRDVCGREGATLFMGLLAGFCAVLQRWSGQDDIVVGSPTAGRGRTQLEPLIGFFVNTLVLRVDCSGAAGFADLVRRARTVCLDAYAHQQVPFEMLVERLKVERDASRNPLFQIGFALQDTRGAEANGSGTPLELQRGTAIFDLSVHVWQHGDGRLGIQAEYNTDLFEHATIERLLGHWVTLMRAAVADPGRATNSLPLLTADERDQVLTAFNATDGQPPADACVHDVIAACARSAPDAPAVGIDGETLTYGELERRADTLAHALAARGVRPGTFVAVSLERSLELIVALLATWKAGGAYVPLDPTYPADRLRFMLTDADPRVLVTRPELAERLGAGRWDVVSPDAEPERFAPPLPVAGPDDLAYLIYTSGSTGVPKGAMVRHRGLVNVANAQQEQFGAGAGDRVLQFASASFDASAFELLMALCHGGSLHLGTSEQLAPGPPLLRFLRERAITIVTLPPTALGAMEAAELPALRVITVAGEACPAAVVDRWADGRAFFNLYGPTEAAIWSHAARCRPGAGKPPIGRPITNVRGYVLDERLEPVPVGVPGELCLAGVGVGAGYWRRPELTRQRFVAAPWDEAERLYRTGDRVRWRADGTLEFLGRRDDQVKLRGFRIEPGEIEAALTEHPGVREAAVVARRDAPGSRRLVAYVLPERGRRDDRELATTRVREWGAIYDETYGGAPQDADPEHDFTGWRCSYTGAAIPQAEMEEWSEHAAARILGLAPRRILELGCGSGLLAFRLAPHCDEYVGTDLSAAAVARLERHARARGLDHVRALALPADDLSPFAHDAFDVVVLNSVVQYFPSVDYLLAVLDGALGVLADGGAIFVGDVRNRALLDAFHASVELHGADDALPVVVLRERVRRRRLHDAELALDPEFFFALTRRHERLTDARVELKRGRSANELTAFRCDVILDTAARPATPVERCPSVADATRRAAAGSAGRVEALANRRTAREEALATLLEAPEGMETVAELRAALAALDEHGTDPEAVYADAEAAGMTATTRWTGAGGAFDAIVAADGAGARFTLDPGPLRPWRAYADDPLEGLAAQRLVPELRAWLGARLPEWMVPSALITVDSFPRLGSGKVDRARLPAPEPPRPARTAAGPSTPAEQVLAGIWCDVLGLERVAVDDNFFEIGGDSILSIQIVSRAAEAGLHISAAQVFQHQTVAELAAVAGEDARVEAEQGDVTGAVPSTPVQRWYLEQDRPHPEHFNQSVLIPRPPLASTTVLEDAVAALLRHHDQLRARFTRDGGDWRQSIAAPGAPADVTWVDEDALEPALAAAQAQLDLEAGPLLRVVAAPADPGRAGRLGIVVHHLAVDAVSWRILLEDLEAACLGRPLPPKTTSFRRWATLLTEHAETLDADEVGCWQRLRPTGAGELPTDFPGRTNREGDARAVTVELDAAGTHALLGELPVRHGADVVDVLLATLALAAWPWTGGPLWLDLEGHGREEELGAVDLTRTVGWFTTLHPLLLAVEPGDDGAAAVRRVRDARSAVPRRGIGYGIARHLHPDAEIRSALAAVPSPQIAFNYFGRLDGDDDQGASGPAHAPDQERAHLLEVNARVTHGSLRATLTYSAAHHAPDTVGDLAERWLEQLRALAAEDAPAAFLAPGLQEHALDSVLAELEA